MCVVFNAYLLTHACLQMLTFLWCLVLILSPSVVKILLSRLGDQVLASRSYHLWSIVVLDPVPGQVPMLSRTGLRVAEPESQGLPQPPSLHYDILRSIHPIATSIANNHRGQNVYICPTITAPPSAKASPLRDTYSLAKRESATMGPTRVIPSSSRSSTSSWSGRGTWGLEQARKREREI